MLEGGPREIREVMGEESDASGKWFRIRTFLKSATRPSDPFETAIRMEGSRLVERDPQTAPNVMAADFGAPRGRRYQVEHQCTMFATNTAIGQEILISYASDCADYGIMRARLRANVGLVSFTSDSGGGLRTRKLVAARIAGKDLTF